MGNPCPPPGFRPIEDVYPPGQYEIHPADVCDCINPDPPVTLYLNIPGLSGQRVVERAHIVEVS